MLMEGFLAMTDVLEPQRLFLPAALPASASLIPPSGLAGGVLLPEGQTAKISETDKYASTERPRLLLVLLSEGFREGRLKAPAQGVGGYRQRQRPGVDITKVEKRDGNQTEGIFAELGAAINTGLPVKLRVKRPVTASCLNVGQLSKHVANVCVNNMPILQVS